MALITLDRIILGVTDEVGDSDHKHLVKFMRYGNLAVKDLYLYVVPFSKELSVQSQVLPINDNFYVDLPEDFVSYIKIGLYSGGRIAVLGLDDNLASGGNLNNANCPCTEEATTELNNILCGTGYGSGYTFYNSYRRGQEIGEKFGLRGGQNFLGYYKLDYANNRILLSTDIPTGSELIIEYKSDPTFNGICLVPTELDMAIRSFVHWRNNMNKNPALAREHKEDYYVEYRRLKKFYSSLTDSEWRDIFLQATTSTVKR